MLLIALTSGLAAAACAAPPGGTTAASPAPTTSPTPFHTLAPTVTPAPVGIWISPALPERLRTKAVELADARSDDVRLEPSPQVQLSAWVYALVAPFPTETDEVDEAQLRSAWRGEGNTDLVASQDVLGLLEALYGPGAARPTPADADLVEDVWARANAWAIVPFEQLEPRWKVLRLEGASPIERDFPTESYPLTVSFGASGEDSDVERVVSALDWPETNRDPAQMSIVTLTGVTALTRATAWAIELNGIDWAVGAIEPWFRTSDVVHISHEVSFATDCPPVNPSRDIMRFCGQPEQIEVLERLGTAVVELTGNHVMDWGPEAFLYSLDAYRSRGWSTYGGGENVADAQEPARIEHNGNRLAFLGCNAPGPGFAWATSDGPGAAPCDMDRLQTQIADLRSEGYLPIVTFQWAESYRRWPVPNQAEAFRDAARAGALIVSGSQAHQAQGFEFIDGAFIHYGPGNLFFDQMWSLETRQEFIDRYVFYAGSLVSVDLRTALLEEYARPRPMTEAERSAFLREIFSASG